MGADLYMNPPKTEQTSLDQQVKAIIDENRELRKDCARLSKQVNEYKVYVEELKQAIKVLKEINQ